MARQLESGNMEFQCERLSAEATYSSLFARDLDFPLQSIFLSLDPVSLKNGRLVCKEWSDFIKSRVWGTSKDSEPYSRLRQRLAYHWIHATPTVKSIILQLDNPVHSLSCDDSVVVCGMEDDNAKVYDLVGLNLLADLDCRPPPAYQPRAGFNNLGNVTADVGCDVVATVTMKGDVSVWRKSDWSPVFKQRLHGDYGVTHVKVVDNLIITGGDDARLALLSWDGDQVSLMRMIEEEQALPDFPWLQIIYGATFNSITGLDSDGEWLLYGTRMELKVWNLADNKMALSCNNKTRVRSVVLNYPYAVVAGDCNGLVVMDLRTGHALRHNWAHALYHGLHRNKTILAGSEDTDTGRHSVFFCDLHQITNPQQNGPHWKRRKYLEEGTEVVRSCVNTSCVVAVQGNKLHVWDFWNCDDFNDGSDDFINDVDEFSSDSVVFSDHLDDLSDNSGEYSDNPDQSSRTLAHAHTVRHHARSSAARKKKEGGSEAKVEIYCHLNTILASRTDT